MYRSKLALLVLLVRISYNKIIVQAIEDFMQPTNLRLPKGNPLFQAEHNRQHVQRQGRWLSGTTILLCIALMGVVLYPTPLQSQSCPAKKILFVGSTAPLEARDEPLRLYLFALGHAVTVRSAAAVQANDANGQDLIIISESTESVEVNTKLRDVAVPIVTWEGWLQDDFKMTGATTDVDYGENLKQQTIRIVDDTHPLAAGLSGVVTTVTNNRNKFQWGRPNSNASIVAVEVSNAQHAMIYAYEQGAQMTGMNAPARRIFIHNATGPSLTMAGWRLFEAAVNWAVGCSNPPLPATPTLFPTSAASNTPIPTSTSTPIPTSTATATPTVRATITATPIAGTTPSSTPPAATATPPPPRKLTVHKQDLLFVDADEDEFASNGDLLLYIVNIHNTSDGPVTGIALEDLPDGNTTLQATTVRTDHGSVLIGNLPTDHYVIVNIGDLAAQQSARIVFQVQIRADPTTARLRNQAQVRYSSDDATGQAQQVSDDPDTLVGNDETITPLGNPAHQTGARMFLPVIAK